MRLTERRLEFLRLVRACGWITTGQVHRRFFAHATPDAARKWLRERVKGGDVRSYRQHRMAEALFTLGPEGKRVLEREGIEGIVLERRPPRQHEHRVGVNDLRIAVETALEPSYFFAYWELPALGWKHAVVPDAVFAVGKRAFAVEYDRGLETIQYFLRTKVAIYRRGLEGFPLAAVLVIADNEARARALAKAIGDLHGRFLFTTIELVRRHGMRAAIFRRNGNGEGQKLV